MVSFCEVRCIGCYYWYYSHVLVKSITGGFIFFQQGVCFRTRHQDRNTYTNTNTNTKIDITTEMLRALLHLKGTFAELAGKVTNSAVENAKMANEIAIESAVTPSFHASHISFPVYLFVLGLN